MSDYTPYQKRQVLSQMVEKKEAADLVEASKKFGLMEFSDPESVKSVCAQFDGEPT